MKVTVITATYNSQETIEDTLKSVLNQNYQHIEHIIVDGLSSDNTLSIIRNYEDKYLEKGYRIITKSEKDLGIYDAMNKGINIATGEIIGILNSDDFYSSSNVINLVVNEFMNKKVDCVVANIKYVNPNDTSRVVRMWKTKIGNFNFGWNPPHPGTFFLTEVYKSFGLYRTDFKISSDYDFMYRAIHKGKISLSHLNDFVVVMRTGGESTKNFKSNIRASREIYTSLKSNNSKFKLVIVMLRLFRKIIQFM